VKQQSVDQHSRKPLRHAFLILVLSISALAAVTTSIAVAAGLKPWVMFLAWTAFGLGKGNLRGGIFAILVMFVGIVISMLTTQGWLVLQPYAPFLALPVAVFLAVVVVLSMALIPPIDNIPACFIGLSTYFASQMDANISTFAYLAAAVLLGGVAAATAMFIGQALQQA
jgi:hypothetical protein